MRFSNPISRAVVLMWLVFLCGRALPAVETTFAADWETTYGHMKLKVDGTKVTGTYRFAGGAVNDLSGKVDGRKLDFKYTEASVSGEGSFTLSADGQAFVGRWRENGGGQWQPWAGRRAAAAAIDFSGVWKTSYGMMRLIQTDDALRGCYTYGERSDITGTVKGGVLRFSYREPSGISGSGEFKLSPDAAAFSGTWHRSDEKEGGEWNGSRIEPTAGRTWLVVLEAHWESNLLQNEYSYGGMLRQFFSRVPSVAVRHRYFDGREDFAKWCAELPYINEPIVLYVSSHGSEAGITVGKELLDGKFIGGQLRYAPNVKLVHLGACLAMSGPTAAELRKASGLNFPVSGFTKVADWSGSAVIDFSYLDLILSRQMKPGEAVRQIRKSVSFAGDAEIPDVAIPPAGLRIVE